MRAVTDDDDDDNAGQYITTTRAIYRQLINLLVNKEERQTSIMDTGN